METLGADDPPSLNEAEVIFVEDSLSPAQSVCSTRKLYYVVVGALVVLEHVKQERYDARRNEIVCWK